MPGFRRAVLYAGRRGPRRARRRHRGILVSSGRRANAKSCPECQGARLNPVARAVRLQILKSQIHELQIGSRADASTTSRQLTVEAADRASSAAQIHRPRRDDCPRHSAGDPRAAEIPVRSRPGLFAARPRRADAFRRREPAHPAGRATRLEPQRRALHSRRTDHRPALPATTSNCSPRWTSSRRAATPLWSSSMTRRRCGGRIISWTSVRAPGVHGGRSRCGRDAGRIVAPSRIRHRTMPAGAEDFSEPRPTAAGQRPNSEVGSAKLRNPMTTDCGQLRARLCTHTWLVDACNARQQSEEPHRAFSAGPAGAGHRRQRFGQEHVGAGMSVASAAGEI